jgi:tartrate-resistant acid phosphatase type 5
MTSKRSGVGYVASREGRATVRCAAAPAVFVALLLSLQLYGQTVPPAASRGLNFLVLSDWGGKGGTTQVAVARQMVKVAAARQSRFVVTCGDNYHGYGISSADSPRWQSEYEDVYQGSALMIPWYASLGNHDNRGEAQAEIDYSKKSARWKMPARYYTHTEKVDGATDALFVHLDTSPFIAAYRKPGSSYKVRGQDSEAQLRWLESVLADSKARWKIVVGHHPIYSAAPAHGDTKELVGGIMPLLEKHGVQFYFCGHDHVLQHLVHGPVNMFICGGGATHRPVKARDDVRFGAGSSGFLSMTLTGTEAEATFVDDKGKELYTTKIPRDVSPVSRKE